MNAARTNFQARMDAIKQYMEHHNVPYMLQTRVKRWAHYAWSRTQALDEGASLEMLPERLRTEIAIHVHLDTLRKVKIFKDCEQGLLCELVLKLRPQIFSPGDYICRCGEIGREMYIINNGKVEVVIPDSNTGEEVVVASLTEGNYFGEISLLRLDAGKNRLRKRIHFKWHKLCPTTICWLTFSIHEIGISTFFFEHLDALLMCAQWVTQNCCVSLKRT